MTPLWSRRGRGQEAGSCSEDTGDMTGASMESAFKIPQEIAAIRAQFAFLIGEFGFAEVAQKSGTYESSVTFKGEHAGVIVSYSQLESARIDIARLVESDKGGKMIPLEGAGYSTPLIRNVFDLREVLKLRAPEEFTSLTDNNWHTKFPRLLEMNAKLLRQHCQDMLLGDFQLFEALNRASAEAVRKMREDAGMDPL